jgi:hypothetical protein
MPSGQALGASIYSAVIWFSRSAAEAGSESQDWARLWLDRAHLFRCSSQRFGLRHRLLECQQPGSIG